MDYRVRFLLFTTFVIPIYTAQTDGRQWLRASHDLEIKDWRTANESLITLSRETCTSSIPLAIQAFLGSSVVYTLFQAFREGEGGESLHPSIQWAGVRDHERWIRQTERESPVRGQCRKGEKGERV